LRGGIVENIYLRNCEVGEVSDAVIKVNFRYGEGDVGEFTPIIRNIFVDKLTSKKSKYAIHIEGYKRSPVTNMSITNSNFSGVKFGNKLNHYKDFVMENVSINEVLQ
jgi:hypothetical protein